MKATKLSIGMVLCASFCLARPTVDFGLRTTRFMIEEMIFFPDGTFDTDIIYEMYWGVSGDLVINLSQNFALRFESFEFKKFDRGGTGLVFFSNVDTDIIFTIPIGKKFSPLIYGGFRFEHIWGLSANDLRGIDPAYELRAGLGSLYHLKNNIALHLDIELYTKLQTQYRRMPIDDMVYNYTSKNFGFNKINLGGRFALLDND
ncbi:MAG: hypothetical protein WBB67_12960 [bacterium]